MKKYSFEIRTVKNLQDESSPHVLAKFEFIAENEKSAKLYQNSLKEHFNENMPYRHPMPRTISILKEVKV